MPADAKSLPAAAVPGAGAPGPTAAEAAALAEVRALLASERAARQRAERALELRTCALNSSASHFVIVDVRQHGAPLVFVNKAIARDRGCEPEDMIGKSSSMIGPTDANGPQAQRIRAALRAGEEVRCEFEVSRADGSTFMAGIFLGPVRDQDGCVTHYVGFGRDITQRLKAERKEREMQAQLVNEMREHALVANELRLAQKLEAVGRLASGIAHEINTPIQYVSDSVHFLRDGVADLEVVLGAYRDALNQLRDGAPVAHVLAAVADAEKTGDLEFVTVEIPKAFDATLEGIERVAGLVRAMKEFGHPDSGEQSPADINRALETTLTIARNEYKYSATVETQFGVLPLVMCSIGELNQVFLNLIVNAAHAIEQAGKNADSGRIRLITSAVDDVVEIRVEDNGCGIPPQNLEKIFDPFFTTKEVGKGTGQGLAIARSIVCEKHRGELTVSSDVGVGTRFSLRLPATGRARSETPA
jgi:two-component system NtrC family sensor kinase